MYAVFENYGFYEAFDNKDEAKACAAKIRAFWKANGRKCHAYIRKLTKEERKFTNYNKIKK